MQQQIISLSDYDVWWKVDFIQQLVMTSSVAGPRRSSKALPKAKLAPKKSYGHYLVICCLSDPLQLSESWRNHYIWEVCSANWWDAPHIAMPAAGIGQQKGPSSSPRQWLTTRCTTNAPKVEQLGYNILPHLPYLPDLLPTDYHFKHLNNFLQGKCFHSQQEVEDAFQEFVESWSTDFYATGINKLISHWQKCVYCNGSYFD